MVLVPPTSSMVSVPAVTSNSLLVVMAAPWMALAPVESTVPALVMKPPVMVAVFRSRVEPAVAVTSIVPLSAPMLLVTVRLSSSRVPPSARSVPALATEPALICSSPPVTLSRSPTSLVVATLVRKLAPVEPPCRRWSCCRR